MVSLSEHDQTVLTHVGLEFLVKVKFNPAVFDLEWIDSLKPYAAQRTLEDYSSIRSIPADVMVHYMRESISIDQHPRRIQIRALLEQLSLKELQSLFQAAFRYSTNNLNEFPTTPHPDRVGIKLHDVRYYLSVETVLCVIYLAITLLDNIRNFTRHADKRIVERQIKAILAVWVNSYLHYHKKCMVWEYGQHLIHAYTDGEYSLSAPLYFYQHKNHNRLAG